MSADDSQPTKPACAAHAGQLYQLTFIFDGKCQLYSIASTALPWLPDVGIIIRNIETPQQSLTVQCDEPPFLLVSVGITAEQTWHRQDTTDERWSRAGLLTLVQDIVRDRFEHVSDTVRGDISENWESAKSDRTCCPGGPVTAKYHTLTANGRDNHHIRSHANTDGKS